MKPLSPMLIALLAAGLMSGPVLAQTKADHKAEKQNIEATYKSEKAACKTMSGNAKDVCEEEAKGKEKVAKADLTAREEPTARNQEKARVARADAAYEVAKEKCDDQSGNAKDVCKKDAKAEHVKAVENAKVAKAMDTPARGGEQKAANVAEARKDAAAETREADYKAAAERCDTLSGATKDTCVADAKRKFGQ